MTHRYAVLWERDSRGGTRPAGVVVEQDGFVLLEARDDLCLPVRYEEPFVVGGPDMTVIRYTPDDPQYFEHVLLDLSRTFAVGHRGSVPNATSSRVQDLCRIHVLAPLRAGHFVEYHQNVGNFRSVRSYRRRYYAADDTATDQPDEAPEASVVFA